MSDSIEICTFADVELSTNRGGYSPNLISSFFIMSKGNMLLGHARGKVGDLVFSRTGGQQVVRARAAVVKNPRSEGQMIQRIILNTVAQSYSRMRAITDHSFEGVQSGQKTMSAYLRKNLDNIRTRVSEEIAQGYSYDDILAFTPIGQNRFIPGGYIVSQGSLPAIDATVGALSKGNMVLNANTYGDVISQYGLKRGDQITFIGIHPAEGDSVTFHYCRVILDPVDANGDELPLTTTFVGTDDAIVSPNPRNEGDFFELAFASGIVSFRFADRNLLNTAIIVSRKAGDGSWLRSNATMAYRESDLAGFYPSLLEALQASSNGGFDTLSERYLNNAGTGVLAEGVSSVAALLAVTSGGVEIPAGESELSASVLNGRQVTVVSNGLGYGASIGIGTTPGAVGVVGDNGIGVASISENQFKAGDVVKIGIIGRDQWVSVFATVTLV